MPIYGDGSNVPDWLHVSDHCDALMAVIERGRIGETYNIGGANERNNLDVVGLICDVLDQAFRRGRPLLPLADRLRHRSPGPRSPLRHRRRQARRRTRQPMRGQFRKRMSETIHWYFDHEPLARRHSGAYKAWIDSNYGLRAAIRP